MLISIDAEKHWQNPTPTQDENSQQTKHIGNLPQFDIEHLQKATASTLLTGERQHVSSLRLEEDKDVHS